MRRTFAPGTIGAALLRHAGDLQQSPAIGCVAIGAMISAAP